MTIYEYPRKSTILSTNIHDELHFLVLLSIALVGALRGARLRAIDEKCFPAYHYRLAQGFAEVSQTLLVSAGLGGLGLWAALRLTRTSASLSAGVRVSELVPRSP